jgi:hypothetical protein
MEWIPSDPRPNIGVVNKSNSTEVDMQKDERGRYKGKGMQGVIAGLELMEGAYVAVDTFVDEKVAARIYGVMRHVSELNGTTACVALGTDGELSNVHFAIADDTETSADGDAFPALVRIHKQGSPKRVEIKRMIIIAD